MILLSTSTIAAHLQKGDEATTADEKGTALEDLAKYLFGSIPGIIVVSRDEMDIFKSDEIDIGCRIERHPCGLLDPIFPFFFPLECKNWEKKIGSEEVAWFDKKLKRRSLSFGIIIATKGITGDKQELTNAHQHVTEALLENRRIIILKRGEIESLSDSSQLVELIKRKLCELLISRTCFS